MAANILVICVGALVPAVCMLCILADCVDATRFPGEDEGEN